MPRIAPPVVAFAVATLLALPSAAQEATPAPLPATPEPSECRVEPRPASFIEDAVRRAVASSAPVPTFPPGGGGTITPTPIAVSEEGSQPADAETVAAATATVREYFACISVGDFPRLSALYTEQAARDNLAFLLSNSVRYRLDEGTPAAEVEAEIVGEFRESFLASPTALPADRRPALVAVANVRTLRDGRVVAGLVGVGPGGVGQWRALLVEEGGRLLVAAITAALPKGTSADTPVSLP